MSYFKVPQLLSLDHQLKKKKYILEVESYALLSVLSEGFKPGKQTQITVRDCSEELRKEPGFKDIKDHH